MTDSTRLNQSLGDEEASEVRRAITEICRRELSEHNGVEGTGDGLMLAFQSARRAVRCAQGIQQRIESHNAEHPAWEVHLRMGMHTGEVIHDEEDLFGETVIIASRLEAAAEPDTILASSNVHALLGTARAELIDRGTLALKGIEEEWQVYEVPWRSETAAASAAGVPSFGTSFVGRDAEIAEVFLRLELPDCRLVTVLAPGGMGKTPWRRRSRRGRRSTFRMVQRTWGCSRCRRRKSSLWRWPERWGCGCETERIQRCRSGACSRRVIDSWCWTISSI